jgi:uncharacterized cupin superfamily protein
VASELGQVAVVVPVRAAEPLVSGWRERYDASAAQGMPAHVTALYPFLPEHRLTDTVLTGLRELCAESPLLDVAFRRIGRFRGVLYLEPDPADGLRRLTLAIAARWPEAPPYEGRFDEVVPHLTVATGVNEDVAKQIEAALRPGLPLRARLAEACVYVFDGARWRLRMRLPFATTCERLGVGVKKTNILSVELDERLDEAGFRHLATSLGSRLGAQRIGASVYQAEAGVPIWPYHYHHGVEEWLYVIAGAPVRREPAGERILAPGDLVCFPSGHQGAHTVKGAGRFVIFATGQHAEPWMSVYPDSDKVSGPEGILLRSSAVGYWHGEGTAAASEAVPIVRERTGSTPRPVVNVAAADAEAADPQAHAGDRHRAARLGPLLGAERLDATVVDLEPGQGSEPYHYVFGREQWLLVLAGTPTLRHQRGHDQLEPGDLVCLPEGAAGAHQLLNGSARVVRALLLSTAGLPANVCYPDTGEWQIRNAPGQVAVVVRETGPGPAK